MVACTARHAHHVLRPPIGTWTFTSQCVAPPLELVVDLADAAWPRTRIARRLAAGHPPGQRCKIAQASAPNTVLHHGMVRLASRSHLLTANSIIVKAMMPTGRKAIVAGESRLSKDAFDRIDRRLGKLWRGFNRME
ncbi:hypothetical protein AK812_SmicGene41298 [Symbiodinium microadriaticum]|uniref:Uncharacterized protein n=1 Tax=Symbiodinium microadriaticum TaxID=2951 RepID=A0A1Q9C6F5_SYMMI|nr:hypothetical protein AK812_SmicGene41298 [Symbiodinium microadriaticum]